MRLDDVGLAGFRSGRLDDVRVDGSLRQPFHVGEFRRFLVEHLDEHASNDLALLFGIGFAGERPQESLLRIHADHAHAHVFGERGHDLIAFAETQQPVIDEHADELVAQGAVEQRGEHGGIDTPRQAQQYFVGADFRADPGDAVLDDIAGGPGRRAAGDLTHETSEDFRPLQRVCDFGMELHAVEPARLVRDGSQRRVVACGDGSESRRQRNHVIAMAHPHIEHAPTRRISIVFEAVEQSRRRGRADLRGTEFSARRGLDATAQLRRHGLHAITDPEHGHAHLEYHRGCRGATRVVHRLGSAGQDHRRGCETRDLCRVDVAAVDFRVNADFAHAARDQLCVLRAEIQDQNAIGVNIGHQPIR
jgi:hypothetical protein